MTLNDIAVAVNGTVVGDGSIVIAGVSTPEAARPGDLVFIDSPRHASKLLSTKASAAIAPVVLVVPPRCSHHWTFQSFAWRTPPSRWLRRSISSFLSSAW